MPVYQVDFTPGATYSINVWAESAESSEKLVSKNPNTAILRARSRDVYDMDAYASKEYLDGDAAVEIDLDAREFGIGEVEDLPVSYNRLRQELHDCAVGLLVNASQSFDNDAASLYEGWAWHDTPWYADWLEARRLIGLLSADLDKAFAEADGMIGEEGALRRMVKFIETPEGEELVDDE